MDPNPNDWWPKKKKEMPCEPETHRETHDKGQNWSGAAASQGTPRSAKERQGTLAASGSQEERSPLRHLPCSPVLLSFLLLH